MNAVPQSLLEVKRLSKKFGSTTVLHEVSLVLREGEVYALLGPNGAGKTTLLSIILGLLHPSSGEVAFRGTAGELAGFVGTPPVYPHLSAYDNLALSYLMRQQSPDQNNILAVLTTAGLEDAVGRNAGEFSTGMRQRLGLARALLFRPRLVILDEPTSGLDPDGIAEVRQIILNLREQQGMSWLISSHILSEVERIANRVCILANGQQRLEVETALLRETQNTYLIATPTPDQARDHLPPGVDLIQIDKAHLVVRLRNDLKPAELNRYLMEQHVVVNEFCKMANPLEEIYFRTCYG